jgi:hypothetical protein
MDGVRPPSGIAAFPWRVFVRLVIAWVPGAGLFFLLQSAALGEFVYAPPPVAYFPPWQAFGVLLPLFLAGAVCFVHRREMRESPPGDPSDEQLVAGGVFLLAAIMAAFVVAHPERSMVLSVLHRFPVMAVPLIMSATQAALLLPMAAMLFLVLPWRFLRR